MHGHRHPPRRQPRRPRSSLGPNPDLPLSQAPHLADGLKGVSRVLHLSSAQPVASSWICSGHRGPHQPPVPALRLRPAATSKLEEFFSLRAQYGVALSLPGVSKIHHVVHACYTKPKPRPSKCCPQQRQFT